MYRGHGLSYVCLRYLILGENVYSIQIQYWKSTTQSAHILKSSYRIYERELDLSISRHWVYWSIFLMKCCLSSTTQSFIILSSVHHILALKTIIHRSYCVKNLFKRWQSVWICPQAENVFFQRRVSCGIVVLMLVDIRTLS